MHRTFFMLFIAFAILLLCFACGGSPKGKTASADKPLHSAAPDTGVPAEMGGPGFDQIAEAQGWITNQDFLVYRSKGVKKGGTFVMSLPDFPITLRAEGRDANNYASNMINEVMYESLLNMDYTTFRFYPGLATHWKISEDKMTYWFRINPNAFFSDGHPVTAEDVLYSWKLMVNEGILEPYGNILYQKYEPPEVISKYIVKVRTKELNWRYIIYFGLSLKIMPAHKLKDLDGPGERDLGKNYLKTYQFKNMPHTGPYDILMKDVKKGKSIAVTRRRDYWNKDSDIYRYMYNFDKIKIKVVRDERLEMEKFKKGELDFYQVGRAQWWVQEFKFDAVRRGLVQKRKVYTERPRGYGGLALNMREFPFNDKRTRYAIAHLFNREQLIEKLFYNEYIPTDSYYPGTRYENPDNPKRRYDPEKARQLLKEAGWTGKDAQGYLMHENGQRFELDFTILQQSNRIFTVVQQDFKQAGIKLNISFATQATLWQLMEEFKFKMHYQNWGGLVFPNPESSMRSDLADRKQSNNICGIKDERIDTLLDEYNICFDQQRRIEIIREIDAILMDIAPYALSWSALFDRIVYWNKFGVPTCALPIVGNWTYPPRFWWYDEAKAAKLKEARKDKNISFPQGNLEVRFWEKFRAMEEQEPDMTSQQIWQALQ